ncbi:HAD family hydrolase [Kibdelosporangium persicum]|uniref:Phosphoglycolate phosphatase n=1 Tax=Kibdelosporangium persicum TaxID=2698649 RepID=A0ABX2FDW8_9PSEU|nr:HAD family hydrolase [Kibdelosporangium persicum]NRN69565.1 Phosphoglycolate phosphatase [Kibdelosporangium persicum]
MSRTVIFDVDGTLVDTNYHHTVAWFRAFRRHDVTVPGWRIHRAIGMGGDRLVAAVAGERVEQDLGDAVRDSWKELFDPMLDEIVPFDGAREAVAEAKRLGCRVALASSGKPDHVRHYLDLLNLDGLADDWTSSQDVSDSKPAPDLLRVALERVGGGTAILIGDSIWDCKAAEEFGVPCAALLTGGTSAAELTGAGAVAVFETLAELREGLRPLVSGPAA